MSQDKPVKKVVLSEQETRQLLEKGRQLVLLNADELREAVRPRPEDFDFRVR